ncbi:MAG: hypothetical protein ABFD54_00550 [Armatimonadota bacterium]|nr:hypothetical protein [bacterium]
MRLMLVLLSVAVLVTFCASSCSATAVDCSALRVDNNAPRWLSAPFSRISVNPTCYFGGATPDEGAPRELGDSLSTGLGYCVGEYPVRLPVFLNWYTGSDTGKSLLSETKHIWFPHKVVVSAKPTENSGDVESVTFLSDASTVCQILKVGQIGTSSIILRGYFPGGTATWNTKKQTLTLKRDLFSVTITFSRPVRWLGASPVDEEVANWLLQKLQAKGQIWEVAFDSVKPGDEIAVAARFMPSVDAGKKSTAPMTSLAAFTKALKKSEADWNKRLLSVPHPTDFTLRLIDTKETTPDQIRQMYYRAWAFLIADTLPPMSEKDYPYPQLACGKESLWAGGHAKSRESAQWESFYAMQFYALLDPEFSWRAFEGMMSLVDEKGTINGESLPSRHAQTAWILYSLTGDKTRLKLLYPAMKRLLVFKASDPRWLYMNLVPEGIKDADFVVSALMDMQEMVRICKAISMPGEADFWNQQIKQLADNYHKWFFPEPGDAAYRLYSEAKKSDAKSSAWCLQGLALPSDVLRESDKDVLIRLYRSVLNMDAPFVIPNFTKYPHRAFLADGLQLYGLSKEAAVIGESTMRGVTLAGEFGETYSNNDHPKAEGVVPSMFGAVSIIDFTLRHNGLAMSDGLPALINMPDTSGGVNGVRIFGKSLNIECDKPYNTTLWGTALDQLQMPKGFSRVKSTDGYHWKGSLEVGGKVSILRNANSH